jgi:hypothetical protein
MQQPCEERCCLPSITKPTGHERSGRAPVSDRSSLSLRVAHSRFHDSPAASSNTAKDGKGRGARLLCLPSVSPPPRSAEKHAFAVGLPHAAHGRTWQKSGNRVVTVLGRCRSGDLHTRFRLVQFSHRRVVRSGDNYSVSLKRSSGSIWQKLRAKAPWLRRTRNTAHWPCFCRTRCEVAHHYSRGVCHG